MINIVIADDHNLVRQGIRALLETAPEGDVKVVAEADNGIEALSLTKRLRPDVLVLDFAMPDMNGPEVLAQLSELNLPTKVLILSMYSSEMLVLLVLEKGAKGYLRKKAVSDELLTAIRMVSRGDTYLSPTMSKALSLGSPPCKSETTRFSRLTPREREVLRLIAQGYTNRGIAKKLFITVKTIEKHRASLVAKLNVNAVAELTKISIKYGLIFLD